VTTPAVPTPTARGATAPSHEVLARFLDQARVRGERSVGRARLVLIALVLLLQFLIYAPAEFISGNPRPWVAIGGLAFGALGSALLLRWTRGAAPPALLPSLSVALDSLTALTASLPGALWPRPDYPGQLHFQSLAFFLLCILAASLRLDRRALALSIGLNLGCVGILLGIDAQTGAAVLDNHIADWLLWGSAFVGASLLAEASVTRTLRLVHDGAASVLAAERARQTLGVYVSEEIAQVALQAEDLRVGGERREVAVLFSDLRGFTRYGQHLSPERLVSELNDYLDAMVQQIRAEGGVVDKYIGDAIMVVFGIPLEQPDAAARALRTALAMQAAMGAHNDARAARGLPPLQQGIGLHLGPVVVGNIGTRERMQYTVIGDAVNVASRLESATKEAGVPILASRHLLEAAQAAGARCRAEDRGTLAVRGRDEGVAVFAVWPAEGASG
jgi:class 3 adenylate cyclase